MADWTGLWANRALLKAVLEFNGCFEPPDFGPAQGRPLGAALGGNPRLWSLFPRPPRGGFWDFEPEPRRLALLPPPVLTRLTLYWGAALLAAEAARIIRGADLRRLQVALGPGLYGYAVKRGRYQLGSLDSRTLAGENLDFTPEQPARLGHRAFDSFRADWPEALADAWRDRWSKEEAGLDFEAPTLAAPLSPASPLWPGLKKVLLSEMGPAWRACFS